jgi:hypothetical protein
MRFPGTKRSSKKQEEAGMLEVTIPNENSQVMDYIKRHVGKLATDWEEVDEDIEETTICFYFSDERSKTRAINLLETLENHYDIRFGEH